MENVKLKVIAVVIAVIVFLALFGYMLRIITMVITNFAETLSDIIRRGVSGGHGIEPVVSFCVAIVLIYILGVVLAKIFKA